MAGRHGNSAVRSNVTIGQISRVTAARPSKTGSKEDRFEKMGHSRCQRRQRFMGNEPVEMTSSWQLKRKPLCSAAQYARHLRVNLRKECGFKAILWRSPAFYRSCPQVHGQRPLTHAWEVKVPVPVARKAFSAAIKGGSSAAEVCQVKSPSAAFSQCGADLDEKIAFEEGAEVAAKKGLRFSFSGLSKTHEAAYFLLILPSCPACFHGLTKWTGRTR